MTQATSDTTALQKPASRRVALRMTIGFWLVWLTITHWPKIELPPLAHFRIDKVVHFAGYAVLAILLLRAFAVEGAVAKSVRLRVAAAIMAIVALAGIVDELTQPYFGRSFEWADYAADLCGGLAGLAIAAGYLVLRHVLEFGLTRHTEH